MDKAKFTTVAGATFSECGRYRYRLWRIWNIERPVAMCIGLNPSTAKANKNDPTISNLIRILSRLGYGGFYMMNLFAWISSKPAELLTCADPLGDNESHLAEVHSMCDGVIVCWGNFKQSEERIRQVLPKYPDAKCFGINKNGTPSHPLALMYAGTVNSADLMDYCINL
jgi:hypothetical protein